MFISWSKKNKRNIVCLSEGAFIQGLKTATCMLQLGGLSDMEAEQATQ
jgi:hypothetical protein